MKITINVEPSAKETSLLVTCKELTPQVEKLLASIRILDKQITVKKDDSVFLINLEDIFYIEALERRTFIYTDKDVFDSEMKLYELESALAQYDFIRVSKNTICSLRKIKSLKSEVDRKIKITLENGYQIIASRMYADELRKKLGV
ncbi:MAG: LytTR family transcriptional regulator DNA-binding domain-containing protein [Treponema sp.]|uniref:LytTR family DNA-binding domain-containing protein n=1 Tax=Treponema sp. TaxID=166 RepID=UPI00298DF64B|nr:LytTR family DNA-binding domain-containing protein [Treponema sp.]MCR5386054.1 LytTR family transcriptional regulator DNA-binding domain-containing protein [Treponema sp.]